MLAEQNTHVSTTSTRNMIVIQEWTLEFMHTALHNHMTSVFLTMTEINTIFRSITFFISLVERGDIGQPYLENLLKLHAKFSKLHGLLQQLSFITAHFMDLAEFRWVSEPPEDLNALLKLAVS